MPHLRDQQNQLDNLEATIKLREADLATRASKNTVPPSPVRLFAPTKDTCETCKAGYTMRDGVCMSCASHCLKCDIAGPGGCNECGPRRMLHARLELSGVQCTRSVMPSGENAVERCRCARALGKHTTHDRSPPAVHITGERGGVDEHDTTILFPSHAHLQ